MRANDLALPQDHPLWQLLQQRVAQLEAEVATLRAQHPLDGCSSLGGAATHARLGSAQAALHRLAATLQRETSHTLALVVQEHQQASQEMGQLLAEGRQLVEQLSTALDQAHALTEGAEAHAASALREAQTQQEGLHAALLALLEPGPSTSIAEVRRGAYVIREQALASVAQLEGEIRAIQAHLHQEGQALAQVSRSLRVALSHVSSQVQRLKGADGLAGRPAPFAELLTAPRPALREEELSLTEQLKQGAVISLLGLLLSASLTFPHEGQLPRNPQAAGGKSEEKGLSRVTMRHWLRDLQVGFQAEAPSVQENLGQAERLSRFAGITLLPPKLPPVDSLDMALIAKSKVRPRPRKAAPVATAAPAAASAPSPAARPTFYTVRPGEGALAVARRFGISLESLKRANPSLAANPHYLRVGQSLIIPATDGSAPAVQAFSQSFELPRTTTFIWPTSGRVTQQPSRRHMALDVAAPLGTTIVAASAGIVSAAGWDNSGYGYMVLVDHGNGFRTRYAHLSVIHVEAGQAVSQGSLIGLMGSTGYSTGPHLHFEIILNGVLQNPWNYLSN